MNNKKKTKEDSTNLQYNEIHDMAAGVSTDVGITGTNWEFS